MFKRLTHFCLGALIFWTGVAQSQTLELSSSGELLDGIAAIVNDGVVMKSQLAAEMGTVMLQLQQRETPLPPRNVLTSQVLERLIMMEVQMQRAEKLGIRVPDEMLNQTMAGVAQRNGISFSDLPQALASQGVDYVAYREEIRRQMTLDSLRQRDVAARIVVTPRELEEYMARQKEQSWTRKDFRLSHILIAVSSGATADDIQAAQNRARGIYQRASEGEAFGQLAVAFSDGQQALEGGDLGWRKGDELPSIFAGVVPNMAEGDVSEPIRSASGFHVIKLMGIKGDSGPVMENQTHARHILVTPNEIKDDDSCRRELELIREQILDGADFGAIAKAVSEDPGSAKDGGDLGWRGPGEFVPAFEVVMNDLAPGQISEPFQSPFGWHLLEVLDRRLEDTTEETEREQALMAIRNGKLSEETEVWMRRLRDQAFVEYRI